MVVWELSGEPSEPGDLYLLRAVREICSGEH